MTNAKFDDNNKFTLLGVSSADGVTPLLLEVDPSDGGLLTHVTNGGGGGGGGNVNLTQVGGASIALGQTTNANSLPVAIASDSGLATAANQTTMNGNLSTIVTNTGSSATAANQTNGTQQTKITDGTNIASILKSDGTAAGQNSQLVAPGYLPVPFTTTSVAMVGTTDVGNYSWVSIQITSQGTSSSITPQVSNDNVNWVALTVVNTVSSDGASSGATLSNTGIFAGALNARYFRLNVTGISAGTTAGTIFFRTTSGVTNGVRISAGTLIVNSSAATGSAVPSAAYYAGLQAQTANPAAATAGNLVGALADKLGKQVVVGSIRDLKVKTPTTITASTAETTVLTAVASTFLDVYGVLIANSSATACNVAFKDSTGGTTQFNVYVPAGDTGGFIIPESGAIPQTTVNNNWTATCSQSVTSINITMLAVKNI